MADIATVWDGANNRGDWQITGGLLSGNQDLATAVLISWFTDAEAAAADRIPDGSDNRRGWYGDDGDDVRMGSGFWLLARAKATQQTLNDAIRYGRDALQWLIDDGVAAEIDVTAEYNMPSFLALQAVISETNGNVTTVAVSWPWQQLS